MTSLRLTELETPSSRAVPGRKLYSRVWLAILCTLWLALLSPRVIFGHTGDMDANHQPQTSTSAASTAAPVPANAPVASTLSISPAQINLGVGHKQTFRLTDQQGRLIHDATWMVSDFTVAELDSVDPPRIAAIAPGELTVTAILGDQTVQAKVNVAGPARLSSARPHVTPSAGRGR